MPKQAQLEIISPSGEMKFYDLDAAKGVANIGRHPDNDVVIDSPGVALFHAVLDHRQTPFQLMLLSEQGETRVRGMPLAPNAFEQVHDWDTIEIDGFSIIVLEGEPTAAALAPAVAPVPGEPVPTEAAAASPEQVIMGAPLPEQTDDLILTEISAREWTVDVESAASFQVTVTNGGDIVAAFDVRVDGIDPSWVTITPPQFNLNERGQTNVTISITAPRLTSSQAGTYPLAVVVTSPNYPGHLSRMSAMLVLNPFYEFFVGELSPKQQTVSWFRRSGQVTIPIGNKGNSGAPIRLDGEDDERGCRFEFEVPGEETLLVKQAEMRLSPDEIYYVPVQITPVRRRLVALRSRQFAYTITASMIEGVQTPRSVMGRVKARPLIGPILLLLMFALLAFTTFFFMRPASEPTLVADTSWLQYKNPGAWNEEQQILLVADTSRLQLTEPGVWQGQQNQSLDGTSRLQLEDAVTLSYDARRFPGFAPTNLLNHQNAFFLKLVLEFKPDGGGWQVAKSDSELIKPVGEISEVPLVNGRYRLRADTWVSGLLPMFAGESREVPVYVSPVEPDITQFDASKNLIDEGEEVTIFWKVTGAETLKLVYNGIEESLVDVELESGQRKFTPEDDTTFSLIASNASWPEPVQKPLTVAIWRPTPTPTLTPSPTPTPSPVPTPAVLRFDVVPREIMAGEKITIDWEAEGADSVSIDPLQQGLPAKGQIQDEPASLTTYRMVAYKADDLGNQVQSSPLLAEVIVNPVPPDPEAPEVQLFEVIPEEVILGDIESVRFTWSVAGSTTDIQLSAPDLLITGLEAQDQMTVTVKETTLYVLTAFNGELRHSASAEVAVMTPTPTPTNTPEPTDPPPPPPTETPTPTPTPFPPPVITYYKAEGQAGSENKVSFQNSYESENGPVYVYNVEAGAFMQLSWQVGGADAVTIEGFGPQPATGALPIPNPITAGATYILTAENNGGLNKVTAFIQVQVVSPPPPPAPYAVTGQENAAESTNTINWSYSTPDRAKVEHFRIYRADVPPGTNFGLVWTTEDSEQSEWVDNFGDDPTCGRSYYVVAVYTDLITGAEMETAASETSWYSSPCKP